LRLIPIQERSGADGFLISSSLPGRPAAGDAPDFGTELRHDSRWDLRRLGGIAVTAGAWTVGSLDWLDGPQPVSHFTGLGSLGMGILRSSHSIGGSVLSVDHRCPWARAEHGRVLR